MLCICFINRLQFYYKCQRHQCVVHKKYFCEILVRIIEYYIIVGSDV